jgi:glucokinase
MTRLNATFNRTAGAPLAGPGFVAGVDFGSTKLLAAVFAPDGRMVGRAKMKTRARELPVAEVLDRVARCAAAAAHQAGATTSNLTATAVGAPGPIDPRTGVLFAGPNLGWGETPLRGELERRLGCPVLLDNDGRLAVEGEAALGAGRNARHWLAIWLGTGVGGGLVLDGRRYTGSAGMAGEIGHVTVDRKGPRCQCGGQGHLDTTAGRVGIVTRIAEAVERGARTALTEIAGKTLAKATSGDLAEAWARGDRVVDREIRRAAESLAAAIGAFATLLNPELVVLGGGVTEALGERFLELVRERTEGEGMGWATADLRIVASELGDDAGVVGAALRARRARPAATYSGLSATVEGAAAA